MDPSLETLFARYRATNDPAALGALFDRTSPQLLALALHLLGHPADAEDALQTTFVTAIDRAHAFDPARPLLPWLCGILTNHCRQVRERRARRREVPELPEIPLEAGSPVQASERRELVARLRQHIERLPFDQRQVLLLQLEHGLAPAEIAEVVGVPPGTVRMRLHRAVKALRGGLPAGLVLALQA
ncbi:MAG: sigma-70 family RNA polymerase sigma factor, partial [Planctomycetes bacterium]|nr:sigma-70 family RNA polymerase sigma factor [Planctomycetota bacterium]